MCMCVYVNLSQIHTNASNYTSANKSIHFIHAYKTIHHTHTYIYEYIFKCIYMYFENNTNTHENMYMYTRVYVCGVCSELKLNLHWKYSPHMMCLLLLSLLLWAVDQTDNLLVSHTEFCQIVLITLTLKTTTFPRFTLDTIRM